MTPDEIDRFIEASLRHPAPPPSRALTDRILAATHIQPEPAFNVWSMFSGWQRALAGAAICVSLIAGLLSGWVGQSTYTYDDVADVPGLTYSPGEMGEGL